MTPKTGAGVGVAGSAVTSKAHDIVLPSQTSVTFKLAEPVVLTPKQAPQAKDTSLAAMIRSLFS